MLLGVLWSWSFLAGAVLEKCTNMDTILEFAFVLLAITAQAPNIRTNGTLLHRGDTRFRYVGTKNVTVALNVGDPAIID